MTQTATRGALDETLRSIYQVAGIGKVGTAGQRRNPELGRGVIGITSAWPGEGKTTVAMALASTLSQDFEGSAVLVDADFATHSIGESYGLMSDHGMMALLSGARPLHEVEYQVPRASLRVVPAGTADGGAARSARSDEAAARFRELRQSARFVVVDLPSVLASATAPVLAQYCDRVLLVTRCGQTTIQDVKRAVSLLEGCRVAGVVMNRWETRIPRWLERSMGLER